MISGEFRFSLGVIGGAPASSRSESMSGLQMRGPRRAGRAAWLFIGIAVAIVATIGGVIALIDIRRDVRARRDEQLARLISHAERSAAHIAGQLQEDRVPREL